MVNLVFRKFYSNLVVLIGVIRCVTFSHCKQENIVF